MEKIEKGIQRIVSGSGSYNSEDEDTVPLCPPRPTNVNGDSEGQQPHSHGHHRCVGPPQHLATVQGTPGLDPLSPVEFETHCHTWWPVVDFSEDAVAIRQLIFVSVMCFLFMTAQIIGGAIANSLSIMTDAAHLSSDLASFLVSTLALYLKRHRPTKRLSFGYHRVETLGALASILVIWMLSAVLCIMAVERIQRHEFEINANEMLIVASLGVAFNIVMGIVLNSDILGAAQKYLAHGHSHGGSGASHEAENGGNHRVGHVHEHNHHGHSHDSMLCGGRNINIRAAFIHVIGDFVQSVGVLIAAILIKIDINWKVADPICTFVFSIIVLCTTITVLRDIVVILAEAVPADVDYDLVRKELRDLPGVNNVHNLHIWNLSTSNRLAIVHLTIDNPSADRTALTRAATLTLVKRAGVRSATVQIEDSPPSNGSPAEGLSDGALGFVDNVSSIHINCDHCRRFTPM